MSEIFSPEVWEYYSWVLGQHGLFPFPLQNKCSKANKSSKTDQWVVIFPTALEFFAVASLHHLYKALKCFEVTIWNNRSASVCHEILTNRYMQFRVQSKQKKWDPHCEYILYAAKILFVSSRLLFICLYCSFWWFLKFDCER